MTERRVPGSAVPRLSQYHRVLSGLTDTELISSDELAERTGFSAAQIRKDLTYFGQFGTPGRGYSVHDLQKSLEKILGIDRRTNVVLMGAGKLGSAVLDYKGLRSSAFRIVACFDKDPQKVGKTIVDVPILPPDKLEETVRTQKVQIGIVSVPMESAQEVVDALVKAGVKAVLNFAPGRIKASEEIVVHTIDLEAELERLSFLSSRSAASPA